MNNLINTSNLTLTELSSALIVFNIIVSLVLGVIIAVVYQKTHKGISYSRSYVESLVMMSVLATIAMMILGNNLVRALGILGVFTLIRFRTIIKDTKDTTFLFFSLAMGMAIGTANYTIAFIGTTLLSGIIFLLAKYNFGSLIKEGYLLVFVADKNFSMESGKQLLDEFLESYKLLQIKSQDEEREYYLSVKFKANKNPDQLINRMSSNPSIKIVDLITGKDAVEY